MENQNRSIYPNKEVLSNLLIYNSEKGDLFWKIRSPDNFKRLADSKTWNSKYAGKKVGGAVSSSGYLRVVLFSKYLLAHRVAFIIYWGYNPENEIDHINRCRTDNRIVNLREVTRICNSRNSNVKINNTSGITGVYLDKTRNKWSAEIMYNYKKLYIGRYQNFEDAVMARWKKECELNWSNCLSDSSAYLYLKENNLL